MDTFRLPFEVCSKLGEFPKECCNCSWASRHVQAKYFVVVRSRRALELHTKCDSCFDQPLVDRATERVGPIEDITEILALMSLA